MRGTVLVVDDCEPPRRVLADRLASAGFRVVEAGDGDEGFARFKREAPDVVLSDLEMPGCDGIRLLERIRATSSVPVVVFTTEGDIAQAVSAIKCGADDFLVARDVGLEDWVRLVENRLKRVTAPPVDLESCLPGRNPAIVRVRERLAALAPIAAPVLIAGEPGTGRDTAARALHDLDRPRRPFVSLDAGSLSVWPEPPSSGTVYIDGLERLPASLATSWPGAVLTTGAGASAALVHASRDAVRWIASTSRPLGSGEPGLPLEFAFGRFVIPLPTLRERPEDVPRIARRLLTRIGAHWSRPRHFERAALEKLREHAWPGNVRELALVVEKLVAFSTRSAVSAGDVADVLGEVRVSVEGMRQARSREERVALIAALREAGGNVTRAARSLGRSRAAVYRMVERHRVPLRGDG